MEVAVADCFLSSKRSTFPPSKIHWRRHRRRRRRLLRLLAHPASTLWCIGCWWRRADKMLQPKTDLWRVILRRKTTPSSSQCSLHSLLLVRPLQQQPLLTLFHVIMYINSFRRRRSHQSGNSRPRGEQVDISRCITVVHL